MVLDEDGEPCRSVWGVGLRSPRQIESTVCCCFFVVLVPRITTCRETCHSDRRHGSGSAAAVSFRAATAKGSMHQVTQRARMVSFHLTSTFVAVAFLKARRTLIFEEIVCILAGLAARAGREAAVFCMSSAARSGRCQWRADLGSQELPRISPRLAGRTTTCKLCRLQPNRS